MNRRARSFLLVTALAVVIAAPVSACGQETPASEPPALVVSVVVDQLRGDLLEHYGEVFTGGLKRLMDEGFIFAQASHAHAVTHTAAGHAAVSTGTFPSRSGIVANSWRQRRDTAWVGMYAVQDTAHPILGFENVPQLPGRSPKNLLRDGLADWVVANDPEARTLSVSAKDRAAITMAGHTRENVYWLQPQLGRFITSTYYAQAYPEWVTAFNEEVMPGILTDTIWNSLAHEEQRSLARADSASYEGDGIHTTFPHLSSLEQRTPGPQAHNAWALSQSRADGAVLEFVKTAVGALELGGRGHLDYLGVSFSATDYVGHGYGPFSQEQLSNLIHLDRVLGDLLEFLDEQVGEGRWILSLTGDHGVVTMPEALQAMGDTTVHRIDSRERINAIVTTYREAAQAGGTPEEIAQRAARLLEERGLVARAYTHQELLFGGEPADSFAVLFRNSHYPGRAHHPLSPYGVEYRFNEGDLVSFPTGTTHGSPYWYDRWVPFILMGRGVTPGQSERPVYTVDIAPTLAALAGIRAPDDLDGRVVYPN